MESRKRGRHTSVASFLDVEALPDDRLAQAVADFVSGDTHDVEELDSSDDEGDERNLFPNYFVEDQTNFEVEECTRWTSPLSPAPEADVFSGEREDVQASATDYENQSPSRRSSTSTASLIENITRAHSSCCSNTFFGSSSGRNSEPELASSTTSSREIRSQRLTRGRGVPAVRGHGRAQYYCRCTS